MSFILRWAAGVLKTSQVIAVRDRLGGMRQLKFVPSGSKTREVRNVLDREDVLN